MSLVVYRETFILIRCNLSIYLRSYLSFEAKKKKEKEGFAINLNSLISCYCTNFFFFHSV